MSAPSSSPPSSSSSSSSPSSSTIKTRFLILSDTHGTKPQSKQDCPQDTDDELSTEPGLARAPTGYREPLARADVVIHCGDLTRRGYPEELRRAFAVLRAIRAPLKLVIAGNHDSALDERFFIDKVGAAPEELAEARRIVEEAERDDGGGVVRYLTEGTYTFDLANGARLRVYASPYTPEFGFWAFQYPPGEHVFDIPRGVDVAMTHGPPLGVLDETFRRNKAGCGSLFRAVHAARPKIHCFGHIHEGWGAYLAQWKTSLEEGEEEEEEENGPAPSSSSSSSLPTIAGLLGRIQKALGSYVTRRAPSSDDKSESITSLTTIDAERSLPIQSIRQFHPQPSVVEGASGSEEEEKHRILLQASKRRGFLVDLTEGETQLTEGEQTLFINAAILGQAYRPTHMPFLVDVDLPKAEGR